MVILITGASGFVGQALCEKLRQEGMPFRVALRVVSTDSAGQEQVGLGNLSDKTNWGGALSGIDTVIHLAARVHVLNEQAVDPLAEYRAVNLYATVNLARQAVAAGVRRFVFISSIKVNGERTQPGRPFCADDRPAPEDAYGQSKYEAELALQEIAEKNGMELVIIRPPLVYGPGVKANFQTMMRWVVSAYPLPLRAISGNRRSLVALDNLVDLIVLCISHPAAANQTFLVSDDEDLSTADLLLRTGKALGRPARLFSVPNGLLKLAAMLVGRREIYQRLCSSLQVDISKTKKLLGWRPPITVDEGLARAAKTHSCERIA